MSNSLLLFFYIFFYLSMFDQFLNFLSCFYCIFCLWKCIYLICLYGIVLHFVKHLVTLVLKGAREIKFIIIITHTHTQHTIFLEMTQRHQSTCDISVLFVSKHKHQCLESKVDHYSFDSKLCNDLYEPSFHAFPDHISTRQCKETMNPVLQ